jgi:glutathione peroxidase
MSIYDFSAKLISGKEISLEDFKGEVILVVNTASKCGFTPQYSDLQKLYEKFSSQGLVILGFPCNQFGEQEPGENDEVNTFCQLNYGVTFPIFEKIDVKGSDAHPLFRYLTKETPFGGYDTSNSMGKILYAMLSEKYPENVFGDTIKWNFTKFLINRDGQVVKRFEPTVAPFDMEDEIKKII